MKNALRKNGIFNKQRLFGYLFILPAVTIIVGLMFYPLLYGIRTSFFTKSLAGPETFIGAMNYKDLMSDPIFWQAALNSIIWTAAGVLGGLIIGLLLALLLNVSITFKGRLLSRGLLLMAWAVPNVAAVIIWRWMFANPFGYLNTILTTIGIINQPISWVGSSSHALWAAIIVIVWKSYPFDMLVLLASMQAIPQELYEVARIDGSGVFQQFRFVTFPLLVPAILIITLLQSIWTFNNFDIVYVLTRGGPLHASEILATYVYKSAFETFQAGYGSSIASLMFLILIFFAILYVNIYKRRGEVY